MAKRNELEVGQEWAYKNTRNHQFNDYGVSHEKATILSVEKWKCNKWGGEARQLDSGTGVLVEVTSKWQGKEVKMQKVVQLGFLWMPWNEYEVGQKNHLVEMEKERAIRDERRKEHEKFQSEIYKPALKEFQDAIEAVTGKYIASHKTIDQLPIEVLQAITNAMKVSA